MLHRFLPFVLAVTPLCATISVSLTPSLPSPQPVGTIITWTPTASDTDPGTIDFRYSVSADNGATYQILQDYDVASTYAWAPYQNEGNFLVQVTARNMTTLNTATSAVPFTISARTSLTSGASVITATANPLVALFSGPGCATGKTFKVKFATGGVAQTTSSIACSPSHTSNIYVAGMYPSTKYNMNYEIVLGSTVKSGPVVSFTTGAIPAGLMFPKVTIPVTGATDTKQSFLLLNALPEVPNLNYFPFATDLKGRVLWYYPNVPPTDPYNLHPIAGGDILMFVANPANLPLGQQFFREIDLSGNAVRQTSAQTVSQQLAALGDLPLNDFNHEALRLPNGHTLVIGSQEEVFPAGTQGSTGPVDILGDAIVDLDQNMQVAWYWSAFDHLDINRPAVLGETCTTGKDGCPPVFLAPVANDWIHGNSLYLDNDGSILFSSRHQDFVYKIDYNNGTGTGNVLWTLGLGGDFAIQGISDPYPWFSHQHDVEFQQGGMSFLTVYDNGNTRISENPGEHSRGQALTIDQTNMTATLTLNADLGHFSIALGTAELLDNGNYEFESGWVVTGRTTAYSDANEVTPSGSVIYDLTAQTSAYRGYRMSSMYSIP